jgi:hypothetical protein
MAGATEFIMLSCEDTCQKRKVAIASSNDVFEKVSVEQFNVGAIHEENPDRP